jgi:hypothetical protein
MLFPWILLIGGNGNFEWRREVAMALPYWLKLLEQNLMHKELMMTQRQRKGLEMVVHVYNPS